MIASLAFGLVAGFAFNGGTLNDLVDALFDQRHKPVVALVSRPLIIKKFEIARQLADNPKDFTRLIKSKSGFVAQIDNGIAISNGQLSFEGQEPYPEFVDFSNLRLKIDSPPSDSIKEGLVNLHSVADAAFVVGDMSKLPWSKPLDVYWYFKKFRVEVAAKDCSEGILLTTLANAIGAKFRIDDKGYHLDLDPHAWRKRMITTLKTNDHLPESLFLPKDLLEDGYRLELALLGQVTDAQIQHAFDIQVGMVIKDLNGEVQQAVRLKTANLLEFYKQSLKDGRKDDGMTLMNRIDWDRWPEGVLLRPIIGAPVIYWSKSGGTVGD